MFLSFAGCGERGKSVQALQWLLTEELKVEPHSCSSQSPTDTKSFPWMGIIVESLNLQVQVLWSHRTEIVFLALFPRNSVAIFPFGSLAESNFGVIPHNGRGGRGWISSLKRNLQICSSWSGSSKG